MNTSTPRHQEIEPVPRNNNCVAKTQHLHHKEIKPAPSRNSTCVIKKSKLRHQDIICCTIDESTIASIVAPMRQPCHALKEQQAMR